LIETLQSLTPALKETRREGWKLIIVALVCAIGGVIWALPIDSSRDEIVLFLSLALGLGSPFVMRSWVARAQQKLVMPHLAKAVHLEYEQNGRAFLDKLPKRLLPKGNERRAEDCLSGKVGDRRINLAEVKVESGGKNSTVYFRGIVLHYQNVTKLPAFFMVPRKETERWFRRVDVSDLFEARSISGQNGELFGVWLSEVGLAESNPALGAVLDVLTNLETKIGLDAKLFSATSNGAEIFIALRKRRNLFKIGGLFASQDEIADNIKDALDDLNLPLQIVSVLLEAERQAAQIQHD